MALATCFIEKEKKKEGGGGLKVGTRTLGSSCLFSIRAVLDAATTTLLYAARAHTLRRAIKASIAQFIVAASPRPMAT